MNTLKMLLAFAKDRRGVTALEYGLIAAGVAVAIIAAVQGLGGGLSALFTKITGSL
jgi:pilus assembly protein Flp/PilA